MKIFQTVLLLLLSTSLLLAGTIIVEWSAEPEQDRVILKWKTSSEEDLSKFVIERSSDNSHFNEIGEVIARGPGFQYRFDDDKLGMTNSLFYYRLRLVNKNGSSQFSETIWIISNTLSSPRTWGSIKALFR
jgi:hypothetical protein